MVTVVAVVYARAGDIEKAIDELEAALSVPNFISIPWVKIDPLFDPLRNHPRFQALLEQDRTPDL